MRLPAALCGAIGLVGLAGWVFSVPSLTSVLPGAVSMKINTALTLVVLAIAIRCRQGKAAPRPRLWASVGGGAFALVLGLLSLAQYVFDADLGIDQALGVDPTVSASEWPGRMAPVTAVCFALLGGASLAGHVRAPWGWRTLLGGTLVAHALACMGLVGYAFGVESLRRVFPFCSIAVHTALALWAASLAMLLTPPASRFLRGILEPTPAAAVALRWIVAVPFLFLALGLIAVGGVSAGLFDDRFALAAIALAGAGLAAFLALGSAERASRIEGERLAAQQAVAVLTESLERRVAERTAELEERTRDLERTLAEVRTLTGLLPICAWCKRIRDDRDYWHTVESYVQTHTDARFTHGMCPDCRARVGTD